MVHVSRAWQYPCHLIATEAIPPLIGYPHPAPQADVASTQEESVAEKILGGKIILGDLDFSTGENRARGES